MILNFKNNATHSVIAKSERQVMAAHTSAKGMTSFSNPTRASHSKVSCILVVKT